MWENGKMVYPLSFTTNIKAKSKGTISTKYEGESYSVKDAGYMSAAPFRAVNGFVYEDDVVTNGQITGIVKFDVRHGMFMLYFDVKGDSAIPMEDVGVIKILGNIHENPELLNSLKEADGSVKTENTDSAENNAIDNISAEEVAKNDSAEDTSLTEAPTDTEELLEDTLSGIPEDVTQETADSNEDYDDMFEGEIPLQTDLPEDITDEGTDAPVDNVTDVGQEGSSAEEESQPEDSNYAALADMYEQELSNEEEPESPDLEDGVEEEAAPVSPPRPLIDIYIAVFAKKGDKKATFAYSVFKDHEKIKDFSKVLNNTDYIKAPVVAIKEALAHLTEEGRIIIHCNTPVIYKPFHSGLVDTWKSNGWKKDGGKVLNFANEWSALYDLIEEKKAEWDCKEKPTENSELAEQFSIASNKYYS